MRRQRRAARPCGSDCRSRRPDRPPPAPRRARAAIAPALRPRRRAAATSRTRRWRRMASVVIDGIALIHDRLAIDQRESPQRRHGLVETVAGERRGERLAEFFPRLGKQEQRDRLRRQQRGVDDQRLGGGMKLGGLLDGEREGLRHRQPVVILGRRIGAHRRAIAPASPRSACGSRQAKRRAARNRPPPARGRAAGRRAPPTTPRPRRARPRGRCGRSDNRRRSPWATCGFRPAPPPRAKHARSR